jgi:ornithine cyclodeaminase/alanine dehydrogenase-like protein (mu-crystallin family)
VGQVRILSEENVRNLLSPLEAQEAVEQAFQDFANGVSRMAQRITLPIANIAGNMRILPATGVLPTPRPMPPTRAYMGVKVYTGYVGPVFKDLTKDRFTVLLYDINDGALLGIIAARWLGAMRTGATAAVATKYMARAGASRMCVIGSGEQAETQVLNLAALRKPERFLVTSRNATNVDAFAKRLRKAGIDLEAIQDCEQAVRRSDVICIATTSREPVIRCDWVEPGTHINAIGANLATRREVDSALIRASRVVVEYREQALQEAGDLVIPLRNGEIEESAIAAELGEVVTGAKLGRTSHDEITLFKSIGVAIEDVAVAAMVYEKSVSMNLGTVVEM